MDLPKRKHPRLKEYDYGQKGIYFITICTNVKQCTLSKIVGRGFLDAPQTRLSDYGLCVDGAIEYLDEHSELLEVDKYVIMPNHVHLLITIISDQNGGASGKPRPTDAVLPKYVSSLKRYTNRVCGTDLWQTGYYDHIIRDDNDYMMKWQYIDSNPAKWIEDEYYSE